MSRVATSLITPEAEPGGASPRARAETAALFLPPGPQDIRIDRPESDTPLPGDLAIGRADVPLVLSCLRHWGIPAREAAPGLGYDIVAHLGEEFGRVRIRVMPARIERRRSRFALHRRHRPLGSMTVGPMTVDARPGELDLVAFVVLHLGRVQFRARPVGSVHIDAATFLAHGGEQRSWFAALSALLAGRRLPPGGGDGGSGAPAWLAA